MIIVGWIVVVVLAVGLAAANGKDRDGYDHSER